MTLRQLEILRALILCSTTVAAARELGMSQPAVSNALKAMEARAGFALFLRSNNRLFPTAEALDLQAEAETIFALHGRLEARVRDLRDGRSGHLRLVSTPPLGYSVIPPALGRFVAARPGVQVFFDVRRYEGVIESVASGVAELGFALGFDHHPGIASTVMARGEMVCVMPPDHALAALPAVSPPDLAGHPFIALERGTRLGEAVRASFAATGTPFRSAIEVRYCNTACVLAGAGAGAAVVDPFSPVQGGSHRLAVRPFRPETPAVSHVLWSEARPLSRLAETFLAEIHRATQALKPGRVQNSATLPQAETANRSG
ncbi:LysR family transcriptional regulator [Lichenibacterium ramalinae]|uniref:LysR family transcriptional regulator n=1 Tax=Lichenibacterium ramalinae TaxID=2316527 RepID=A0A4Q2RCZ7_9HYPH|nr:LysR family transcriptional regulator [Lichenibacterium ramalinae]RYB04638.1 LysR family transcriptional regulator [Lichenibacterium ramalinae]